MSFNRKDTLMQKKGSKEKGIKMLLTELEKLCKNKTPKEQKQIILNNIQNLSNININHFIPQWDNIRNTNVSLLIEELKEAEYIGSTDESIHILPPIKDGRYVVKDPKDFDFTKDTILDECRSDVMWKGKEINTYDLENILFDMCLNAIFESDLTLREYIINTQQAKKLVSDLMYHNDEVLMVIDDLLEGRRKKGISSDLFDAKMKFIVQRDTKYNKLPKALLKRLFPKSDPENAHLYL